MVNKKPKILDKITQRCIKNIQRRKRMKKLRDMFRMEAIRLWNDAEHNSFIGNLKRKEDENGKGIRYH